MAAAQSAASSCSSNHIKGTCGNLGLNDEDDLFDAVLTGSVDREKTFTSNQNKKTQDNANPDTPTAAKPQKRLALYIGNFPWWISGEDILNMAQTVGVKDMTDIKFAENKANGQSRGYVEVVVTSEESMKLLLEKVPQCHLGGERMNCCSANRRNRSVFEDKANQRFPQRAAPSDLTTCFSLNQPATMPQQFLNQFSNTFSPLSNPFLRHTAPPLPQFAPNIPPPPLPFMFPNHSLPVPSQPPPSERMNPAKAGSSQDGHSSKSHSEEKHTDADFDDLMNRNRAVASSAISKAVSGATTGDLRVAMETLLTAIAIIKQSRVYGDNRCQALVTSLKDCLVSIQGNYSRSSVCGEERERDRDIYSSREGHASRRHRERSREQQSRERSRSSQKDKDRYKERDRHKARDSGRYY